LRKAEAPAVVTTESTQKSSEGAIMTVSFSGSVKALQQAIIEAAILLEESK
jgi:hypothetical protein